MAPQGHREKHILLHLRAIGGLCDGRTWPLDEEVFVIGRGSGCNVLIDDKHVSRRHCEIHLEHGIPFVYDRQSCNTTLLNGRPVSRSALRAGDILTIHIHRFIVEHAPDNTADAATTPAMQDPTPITTQLGDAIHLRRTFDPSPYLDEPEAIEELFALFALSRELAKADTLDALISLLETNVRRRLAPKRFWLAWHVPDEDNFVLYSPAPASVAGQTPFEAFRQACGNEIGVVLPYTSEDESREVLAAPLRHGERCFAVMAVERPATDPQRCALALQYLVGAADCAGPLVRAVERLEQLRRDAKQDPEKSGTGVMILGDTPTMANLRAALMKAARGRGNVLILGETGVGKELAARYVHDHSARADSPYVVVNCAAIPSSLFESELFGHAAGAFTDASRRRRGLFQIAHGGTLFLDEIGELSSENQARLLRVVETGVFRPLGSDEELEVNVRVLAASNRQLRDPASDFRPDLLHRIGAFVVDVPPLRDHSEDLPLLARHFLEKFAAHAPAHIAGLAPDAVDALKLHNWPGNVRELRNVIERTCQTARGPLITAAELGWGPAKHEPQAADDSFLTLDEYEKRYVLRVFERSAGNIAEAARILGVARSTLYYKLNTYGIQPKQP